MSEKNKVVALVLAILLGAFGVHRFYLGHIATGVLMLVLTFVTCGIGAIGVMVWVIIDIVLIATGGLRDANGGHLR